MSILAQIFGIIALIAMVLSYQCKERKKLLLLQLASNVFFVANYFMLGASTMGWMCVINVVRSFVFMMDDRRWAKSPLWLYVFLIVALVTGIMSWEGPMSILVIVASLILIFALYSKNLKVTRLLFLFPPLLYISYNVYHMSFGGIGSDAFCLVSAIVAILRFDVRKKKEKPEA